MSEEVQEAQTSTPDGPAELREAYNRTKEENRALRQQLMGTHLSSIGLDPERGLGKAIAKEYSGDMEVEAIAEFARNEYGHEGQATSSPQVAAAQRVDTLDEYAEPVPASIPTDDPRIAALQEAASKGDIKSSIALKLGQT
jgi:hypothetical protein